MRANAGRIRGRTVTGIRTRGKNLVFDFDSGGLRCHKCSTQIVSGRIDGRVTYWCPSCQKSF